MNNLNNPEARKMSRGEMLRITGLTTIGLALLAAGCKPDELSIPKVSAPEASAAEPQQYPLSGERYLGYTADRVVDNRYSAVWGGDNGRWLHQPNLPPAEERKDHSVPIKLVPERWYKMVGPECQIHWDPQHNGNADHNPVVVDRENVIFYAKAPANPPQGKDQTIWAMVHCRESEAGGFSIQEIDPPNLSEFKVHDQESVIKLYPNPTE